jgi:hypothetical protein
MQAQPGNGAIALLSYYPGMNKGGVSFSDPPPAMPRPMDEPSFQAPDQAAGFASCRARWTSSCVVRIGMDHMMTRRR